MHLHLGWRSAAGDLSERGQDATGMPADGPKSTLFHEVENMRRDGNVGKTVVESKGFCEPAAADIPTEKP